MSLEGLGVIVAVIVVLMKGCVTAAAAAAVGPSQSHYEEKCDRLPLPLVVVEE
jgi:hypothetical protein